MGQLFEKIAAEAKDRGAISLARFMELALYCPVYGYYEKERDIGRQGDYFTSVSVGPLFGELLALQFADWLEPSLRTPQNCHSPGEECQHQGQPGPPPGISDAPCLIEAGAHRGELARDILAWLRARRPALFERLQYWIIEPSKTRQAWQAVTLQEYSGRLRWAASVSELNQLSPTTSQSRGTCDFGGVLFSNELLDAMPVHRLAWDARQGAWFEWGVGCVEGRLVWARMSEIPSHKAHVGGSEPTPLRAPALSEALLSVLPDGFALEVSPLAIDWWGQAARVLSWGRLITLDYGFTDESLISPARPSGTLRAYRNHRLIQDVLADPGEQDITAHINFSALRAAGESAGLVTELFCTQAEWLTRIGRRIWQGQTDFGAWTPAQTRQFQTLTHPEHLGSRFSVLVQSKSRAAGVS